MMFDAGACDCCKIAITLINPLRVQYRGDNSPKGREILYDENTADDPRSETRHQLVTKTARFYGILTLVQYGKTKQAKGLTVWMTEFTRWKS